METDATLTAEALALISAEAEAALKDISALPEGSQPFWFRNRHNL